MPCAECVGLQKENEDLRERIQLSASCQHKILQSTLKAAGLKMTKKECLIPGEKQIFNIEPDRDALKKLRNRILDYMSTLCERDAIKLEAILDLD